MRYIESTRHLVIYRLNSSYPMPTMLRLPLVETLCLLDCSPGAVGHLLYRPFFPSLRRIHYLSGIPTDTLVYQRFPSVEWVFPWREGRAYPFYDAMLEAGRGRMDTGLLSQYVTRWGMSMEEKEKEKEKGTKRGDKKEERVWMDIYLPGRGIVSGREYLDQQMAYFHKKHCDGYCFPYPIHSEDYTLPPVLPHAVRDTRWASEEAHVGLNDMFDRYVLRSPKGSY